MSTPIRILALNDNDADVRRVLAALAVAGFLCQCDVAVCSEQLVSRLMDARYDLILAEYRLTSLGSSEVLSLCNAHSGGAPVIFLAGEVGEHAVAEVMREGAADFVLKGQLDRLGPSIAQVLREKEERRRNMVIDDR